MASAPVFLFIGKVREGILCVHTVSQDNADPTADCAYAWLPSGRMLIERSAVPKERRIGKCIKDGKSIEQFARQFESKKFTPGTLDSSHFVRELAVFATGIQTMPAPGRLSDWVDGRLQVELKSIACPSSALALTNKIYISREDESLIVRSDQRYTYVRIGSFTFIVEASKEIAQGCVCFNGAQRTALQLSLNVMIPLTPIEPDDGMISQLTLELDQAPPKQAKEYTVNTDEISAHFISQFSKHILTVEQKIVFEFKGINFFATVLDLDRTSISATEVTTSKASQGMLFGQTVCVVNRAAKAPFKLSGGEGGRKPVMFKSDFNFEDLGIGGLDREFSDIFRRAFASRLFPASVIEKLGIKHVKGLMLNGPPGTGKTLMAREIGKMLNAVEPIVVNGPEILNKFVGASEENIRKLFEKAEKDYKERGEDADLHIIIFDEIDAICKQRGSRSGDTGVGDSVVNQLLSKMDGVEAVNNVLVIGMTNRKDMLDDALLRPGRFEIQIEIGLPDEHGRLQILRIHTAKMAKSGLLGTDVAVEELAAATKNYSGAEIAGVVRAATSYALSRQVDVKHLDRKAMDASALRVNMDDFKRALDEVRPAFGIATNEFEGTRPNGIINYGPAFQKLYVDGQAFVDQVAKANRTPLLSVLLTGCAGSGKTALGATLAMESNFPFVKLISPEQMVSYTESAKCSRILKVFQDAYKSPYSFIMIDDIERLLEYVPIGPRFSNVVLQTLMVLLKKQPPKGHKLLIVGTTSLSSTILGTLGLERCFSAALTVKPLQSPDDIKVVLAATEAFATPEALDQAVQLVPQGIAIKQLLLVVEMARAGGDVADVARFGECIADYASTAGMADLEF